MIKKNSKEEKFGSSEGRKLPNLEARKFGSSKLKYSKKIQINSFQRTKITGNI